MTTYRHLSASSRRSSLFRAVPHGRHLVRVRREAMRQTEHIRLKPDGSPTRLKQGLGASAEQAADIAALSIQV